MRRKILLGVTVLFSVLSLKAETRRALVLGNDSYPGNALTNARNDAKGVYDALRGAGYISTLALDTDRVTLSRKVDDFVDSIHPGDTAVLYYAGHGLQVDGENFLVPVDFHLTSPESAKMQGYSLSSVLERFTEHGAATQIVILDACRDNPFLGSRSFKGGWAGLGTSAGAFLAFGTSPGSTASDAPGEGHGLFTKALLRYLATSDLDVEELFRKVREEVIRESGGKQVPWVSSSLIGSFHVRPELDASEPMLQAFRETQAPPASRAYVRSIGSVATASGPIASQLASTDIAPSEESEKLVQAANLVRGAQFDSAISILKDILSVNPASSIALRLLGLVFHARGLDSEALNAFDRALMIDHGDTQAAAYKCALEGLSNAPSALADCASAVRSQATADGYLAFAGTLMVAGQNDLAYSNVTRSISLGGSDLAYALRGAITSTQGNTAVAKRDYSRAVQLSVQGTSN